MSRIANAWRALMGAEPEVRVETKTVTKMLVGAAEEVTLYAAYKSQPVQYVEVFGVGIPYAGSTLAGIYPTCAMAHAEHPGASVNAFKALRVGGAYYRSENGRLEVGKRYDVKKPKRAKGAK